MDYPMYKTVKVEASNGSYGKWVVKYSDVSFRFFWKKSQAVEFANAHNASMA